MQSYLIRVGLGAGINLALLLPLFALAFLSSRKGKSAVKPVLLFAVLFVLDIALVFSFKLVSFIPSWGDLNWQGKVLEIAWPLLLAALVPMFSAARIGLKLPTVPHSWRAWLIACGAYLVICVPVMFLLGAHFDPAAGTNLPTFLYEASMPGLAEEFVYRGVFLMLLNEAFGRPWKFAGIQLGWGFIIVTVMFGFLHAVDAKSLSDIHIHWSNLIFPLITGVILAWLKERTGSVWPCVLLHNFVNTFNDLFV